MLQLLAMLAMLQSLAVLELYASGITGVSYVKDVSCVRALYVSGITGVSYVTVVSCVIDVSSVRAITCHYMRCWLCLLCSRC